MLLFVILFSVCAQEKLYSNEFPLGDVKLLDGPFKDAMDLNTTVLLNYTVDRLLSSYLKDAGLTPKASDYTTGGAWVGLNGHVGGHYLSAVAMQYAATGNTQCKERMDYMVSELKRCQDANGNDPNFVGYVSGIPNGKSIWRSFKGGNFSSYSSAWVPWYNIHKTYAGLRDAWAYGGSETAKDMFIKLCDWGISICSGLSDNQMQSMLGMNGLKEQGGINEMYADAYKFTEDERYLTFAKSFSHKWLLDPMAAGNDMLSGNHANAQVPKVVGFARIAEMANDDHFHEAADFFWTTVSQNRSIAIGGNSRNEWFPEISKNFELISDRNGVESCNTHNMLKLTEELFRMNQDAKYVDFFERALYNHILSTQHPEHGGYVYFTSAHPKHYRVYSVADRDMWCCVGTGMENHTKYGQFIYTHQSESLFVNLFIPSELTWEEKNVTIRQETTFPDEEQTTLTISTERQQPIRLFIRHPSWVPEGRMIIRLDDEIVSSDSKPSTFVEIVRTWNGGEKITVSLPMHFNIDKIKNVNDWVAITRGPIVLGAKVPTTDISTFVAGSGRNDHSAGGWLSDVNSTPKLTIKGDSFQEEFEPVEGKPFTYTAPGIFQDDANSDLEFMPFSHIHDSRYILYWKADVLGEITPVEHAQFRKETTAHGKFRSSNGIGHFTFAAEDASRRVVVYTLSGQKLTDIPAPNRKLTLTSKNGAELNKGMYMARILSEGMCHSEKICIFR